MGWVAAVDINVDILAKVKFEGVGGYEIKVRLVKLAGSTKCKYNYKYKHKYYQEPILAVGSSVYVGLEEGDLRRAFGLWIQKTENGNKNCWDQIQIRPNPSAGILQKKQLLSSELCRFLWDSVYNGRYVVNKLWSSNM